jgi:hypothetical protein
MVMKKLTDANGNEIEVDDEATLIDGHPDLRPVSPESTTDHQYTPSRPFHRPPEKKGEDWRTKKQAEPTGYANPVDDPEYLNRIQYKGKA